MLHRNVVVRAAGLEPAQRFLTEGFSYPLRLSPPSPGTFVPRRGLGSGLSLHRSVRRFRVRLRCCPSSLYTFAPIMRSGRLARDCHFTGSPEFGQFCSPGFPEGTQYFKSLASTDSATPADRCNLTSGPIAAKAKLPVPTEATWKTRPPENQAIAPRHPRPLLLEHPSPHALPVLTVGVGDAAVALE